MLWKLIIINIRYLNHFTTSTCTCCIVLLLLIDTANIISHGIDIGNTEYPSLSIRSPIR
jgi:hypothetical protein